MTPPPRRVLIVGAGTSGQRAVREMINNPRLRLVPVGFVDDDVSKQARRVEDVSVLGPAARLASIIREHKVDQVVIAMPSAPGTTVREIVRACFDAGVEALTMPSFAEILSGRVRVAPFRKVEIQDLLRRPSLESDLSDVHALIEGRTVLVTGGGGSIGAELCGQIAALAPRSLILLGHGENSIFDVEEELRVTAPSVRLESVIADIRDHARIDRLFARFRPEVVFHAAAHKHVPLMEGNVAEAITNNVTGTHVVVDAAGRYAAERFVLISTDKAVHPTSVMGATKRIAEQIVELAAQRFDRPFVAVRFGNVLGSRGSVIPTFLRQIHAGGPITVTHPEMTRYFMTIPEAVQLVLQAAAIGERGDVFLLDMGEPVKIVDLARDLIRLSGLEADRDIAIRFTGARPGERLFEELAFSGADVTPTKHPKVLRTSHAALPAHASERIAELSRAAAAGDPDAALLAIVRNLVPDYAPRAIPLPPSATPPGTAPGA